MKRQRRLIQTAFAPLRQTLERRLMEILGHSQISTTSDIYNHVMPAQYREVADALDAWLEGHGRADEDGDEDAL